MVNDIKDNYEIALCYYNLKQIDRVIEYINLKIGYNILCIDVP